ncbi:S8 family serine peptidase [Desulfobacterium sp. N47]|uniref:Peptidase S8/S53 domain-containing protein n=1 Tax=uncultured Desulfobacterium sp. TaxID=201089 RepID=E1YG06_9BACT|nr:hypothetical protein N47_J04810 [uncultured Desulfobacterium sp.]
MEKYDHLKLPIYSGNLERQKRGGGGVYSIPDGRNKAAFSQESKQKAEAIVQSFSVLKDKFSGRINPSLIYEIEINQSVSPDAFEKTLSSMGIHVLSVAENRKGYWVVFSDDDTLSQFKSKLATYGSEEERKYDFFNAIDSFFTRTGFGINGMIKPELVEYGGNLILYDFHERITEDRGGKIALLNNRTTEDIIQYDCGTSFSAPKVAHLAGKIINNFPQRSGNFIKNMLLIGADYPYRPSKNFYQTANKKTAEAAHLAICGYGLSSFERAIFSFGNRVVLWDEGQIGLNQMKVYSLQLPDIFFSEEGKKKIMVALTFNPETRLTRGDSYLGNRMEFHLFHSINPQILMEKYGILTEQAEELGVPEALTKFEIDFFPGGNTRKAGCHQKAWKEYKRQPKSIPATPISLVLLNFNKWITDENRMQDYCISVVFEHEREIALYNEIRTNIQTRVRV